MDILNALVKHYDAMAAAGNAAAAGNTTAVRKATKRPMRSRKIMRPSANAGGRSFLPKKQK